MPSDLKLLRLHSSELRKGFECLVQSNLEILSRLYRNSSIHGQPCPCFVCQQRKRKGQILYISALEAASRVLSNSLNGLHELLAEQESASCQEFLRPSEELQAEMTSETYQRPEQWVP